MWALTLLLMMPEGSHRGAVHESDARGRHHHHRCRTICLPASRSGRGAGVSSWFLREVVKRGVTRNVQLQPRSASGAMIPTALNASALRDAYGNIIGAIGIPSSPGCKRDWPPGLWRAAASWPVR